MKLENNNIKISISKQMMEVVQKGIHVNRPCPDTDSRIFFFKNNTVHLRVSSQPQDY